MEKSSLKKLILAACCLACTLSVAPIKASEKKPALSPSRIVALNSLTAKERELLKSDSHTSDADMKQLNLLMKKIDQLELDDINLRLKAAKAARQDRLQAKKLGVSLQEFKRLEAAKAAQHELLQANMAGLTVEQFRAELAASYSSDDSYSNSESE